MRTAQHPNLRTGLAATAVAALAATALVSPSYADPGNGKSEICPQLSSGKIDTVGDPSTITVSDPLAVEVCVKAGLTTEFYAVDSVPFTVGHSKGSVSHYSYLTEDAGPDGEPVPDNGGNEAGDDGEPVDDDTPADGDPAGDDGEPADPSDPGDNGEPTNEEWPTLPEDSYTCPDGGAKCPDLSEEPISDIGEPLSIEHSYDAETGTTTTKVNGEITKVVVHDQSIEEGF